MPLRKNCIKSINEQFAFYNEHVVKGNRKDASHAQAPACGTVTGITSTSSFYPPPKDIIKMLDASPTRGVQVMQIRPRRTEPKEIEPKNIDPIFGSHYSKDFMGAWEFTPKVQRAHEQRPETPTHTHGVPFGTFKTLEPIGSVYQVSYGPHAKGGDRTELQENNNPSPAAEAVPAAPIEENAFPAYLDATNTPPDGENEWYLEDPTTHSPPPLECCTPTLRPDGQTPEAPVVIRQELDRVERLAKEPFPVPDVPVGVGSFSKSQNMQRPVSSRPPPTPAYSVASSSSVRERQQKGIRIPQQITSGPVVVEHAAQPQDFVAPQFPWALRGSDVRPPKALSAKPLAEPAVAALLQPTNSIIRVPTPNGKVRSSGQRPTDHTDRTQRPSAAMLLPIAKNSEAPRMQVGTLELDVVRPVRPCTPLQAPPLPHFLERLSSPERFQGKACNLRPPSAGVSDCLHFQSPGNTATKASTPMRAQVDAYCRRKPPLSSADVLDCLTHEALDIRPQTKESA